MIEPCTKKITWLAVYNPNNQHAAPSEIALHATTNPHSKNTYHQADPIWHRAELNKNGRTTTPMQSRIRTSKTETEQDIWLL